MPLLKRNDESFKDFDLGFDRLRHIDNPYFKNLFFKPRERVFNYSKFHVPIGVSRNGRPYFLDIREAFRMLVVGITRCLDADTIVITKRGKRKISVVEKFDVIKSFSFKEHRCVWSKVIDKRISEEVVFEIRFEDGSEVLATANHRFFNGHNLDDEIYVRDLVPGMMLLKQDGDMVRILGKRAVGYRDVVDIEVSNTHTFILGNGLVSHNSGKTWFLRGFMDRVMKTNDKKLSYACAVPTDTKDEFGSSVEPLQEKFHKSLLPDEKPQTTMVKTYRPIFFKNVRGYEDLPEHNEWYSPDIKDLSELDFMTMMNATGLTDPQKIALKEIYEKLAKEPVASQEVIERIINSLKDFDDRQKMSLRTKFAPLQYSGMLSNDSMEVDFKGHYNNGIVPALNLTGFDSLQRDGAGLPQVFISVWLRKTITLRRQKKIPPIVIMVDEATRFVPADGNPSCKLEITESVDLDARYGINYIFCVQSPDKIPLSVVNQCKYFLIPYNADIDMMMYLFKISGVVSWHPVNFRANLSRLKKSMKKFEWILIDRNENQYEIIKSLSPLSMHCETSN